MPKLTVPDLTAGYRSAEKLQECLTDIGDALENTLSRDGETPNQMEASIDMNGNRILNLADPQYPGDPIRLQDIDEDRIVYILEGPVTWESLEDKPLTFPPEPHTADKVTDFQEAAQDVIGASIAAGTSITVSYNDVTGLTTISAVDAPGASVAWDDITDKPATFAPAAHTQTASTITDFTETVQDIVGGQIVAGTNTTVNYNDTTGAVTISSSGGGGDTSFVQAGTGAVTKTLQEKAREWISVADFKSGLNSWTDAFDKAAVAAGGTGAKGVRVPPGDYTGLGTVTTPAIWTIDPGAVFPSQGTVGTHYPMKNLGNLPGLIVQWRDGGDHYRGLRVGPGYSYQEQYGRDPSISIGTGSFESAVGAIGVVGASNTSTVASGGMGTIGVAGYGVQNNSTVVNGAWGGYFEGVKKAGALGTTIGVEIDSINFGSTVDIGPYGGGSGFQPGLWLSCGGGYGTTNDVSCAIGILNNTAKFRRGLVFLDSSLTNNIATDSHKDAIAMTENMAITWHKGSGQTSYIATDSISSNQSVLTLKSNNQDGFGLGLDINRVTNCVTPTLDNAVNLGAPVLPLRFANIYLTNAPVVSSDKVFKKNIVDLSDTVLDAVDAIDIVHYELIGDDNRTQTGVVAQQCVEAFAAQGLDAHDYGFLDGTEGNYGVKYEQLLVLKAAATDRKLNRILEKLG